MKIKQQTRHCPRHHLMKISFDLQDHITLLIFVVVVMRARDSALLLAPPTIIDLVGVKY